MTNLNRSLNVVPRKKGSKFPKHKINYSLIRNIIVNTEDRKTRALLAFQYGFGCRAGELAREYLHKHYIDGEEIMYHCIMKGPRVGDVSIKSILPEVEFSKPNFKQHIWDADKELFSIPKINVFVNAKFEGWLYDIIVDWVADRNDFEPLFPFKDSAIRMRIGKRLKEYDSRYSPHWLRNARGSHVADITRDVFAVKDLLGHKRIETSLKYISGLRNKLYDVVKPGETFEDHLG